MKIICLIYLLSHCKPIESNISTTLNVLRKLYSQSDILPEYPVNVFLKSQEHEVKYLEKIQDELGLSVIITDGINQYKSQLKNYRRKWEGWVNVLDLSESTEINNYFDMIKERWYTGNIARIGEKRMMDFIYDNIVHLIFVEDTKWNVELSAALEASTSEEMIIILILYKFDEKSYGVYYNRGSSNGLNELKIVNYWKEGTGFFQNHYLIPPKNKIYSNFYGRSFKHPVIHKPPWNYVTYDINGKFLEDNGGRDITLMDVLSTQLNFKHESVDPAKFGIRRTRGSKFDSNQSFPGIIGALHKRHDDFHFYLGDTTQTYNRNKAVGFSFYVLADAGAFVTEGKKRFIPPDLLIKSFSVNIWITVVCVYFVGSFMMFVTHSFYQGHFKRGNLIDRGSSSAFLMIKIFLSQSDNFFTDTRKGRGDSLRMIMGTFLVMVNCTLGASYSGMMVSFFSIPFYAKSLNSLEDLNNQMSFTKTENSMSLGVVGGSSSYGIISTGGGIYKKIWNKMQNQELYSLDSVIQGLEKVMVDPKFAVFAGRQKLLFDTIRLGGEKVFHLNDFPFFVKYKCVAFRNGSPLQEMFNHVILQLHAGGIIDKITRDEYFGTTRRIGEYGKIWEEKYEKQNAVEDVQDERITKIAMKHINGIFYVFSFGLAFSFVVFLTFEMKCFLNTKM
ncbi:ionotropic receptor 40a [Lepeophtheirus salmonis]|uniref:ionotropic receptor 40a n=1 Tax=Lepeophtheirus salmonis TaxID=72036 RepID=UPI001AE81C59|nr:ionotropic receptor 40a-like [Lepeophtheirus salmonis]